jgi:hypothetical protein
MSGGSAVRECEHQPSTHRPFVSRGRLRQCKTGKRQTLARPMQAAHPMREDRDPLGEAVLRLVQ